MRKRAAYSSGAGNEKYGPNRDGIFFGLLLPTLAGIFALTAVTVEISRPFLDLHVLIHSGPQDIKANILLYMPIGIALGRRRVYQVLLIALLISLAAEATQFFYPDRYPSLLDLGANVIGAALGVALARVLTRLTHRDFAEIRGNEVVGVIALLACATFILVMTRSGKPSDFSNWDTTYPLAVGDELDGGQRWHGEILGLAITQDPLTIGDIRLLQRSGAAMPNLDRVSGDVLFRLSQAMDETSPAWGVPLLTPEENDAFLQSLIEGGTFSILVWFRAFDATAIGPRRIVTSSKNNIRRNFTLGQEGTRLKLFLRTPLTGPNGYWLHTTTPSIIAPDKAMFVAATYDGRVVRVYSNGRLIARLNLAASGWRLPFLADAGLPAAGTLSGMLAAVSVLCLGGNTIRRRKWLSAGIGGLLAGVCLLLVGASAAMPAFAMWVPFFAVAGGLVVAASARLGPPKQP